MQIQAQTDRAPTAMQLALMAAFRTPAKPVKRPSVPDAEGQRFDNDYDADPALEQTPVKNGSEKIEKQKR